jgi:gluconolactonase
MTAARATIEATGLEIPEGPVVLPDGRIAFVQQVLGRVSVFDGAKVDTIADTGGAPNAVTIGVDNNLYAAQNGGVVGAWRAEPMITPGIQRISLDGSVEYVATAVGGVTTMAPNDLVFGADGRLYFTDPAHGYDPENKAERGRLFVVDVASGEGQLILMLEPCYCNGIAFMADGRLVWVETYGREVCVLEDGQRRVICQLPENHLPDGLDVAADGRLFITTVASHGVTVVSPDGEILDLLYLDDDALPTNCCFQGNDLWVTDFGVGNEDNPGRGRLWRVETDAKGLRG